MVYLYVESRKSASMRSMESRELIQKRRRAPYQTKGRNQSRPGLELGSSEG